MNLLATVLQLAGLAALVVAAALVAVPLGIAAGGAALFLVGLTLEGGS
ncbi:MAG: hypothetical protein IT196_05300 [Acidimicrobiales bacterium]|nr:hypothetical protein [Acidimicrobiales bacterium]